MAQLTLCAMGSTTTVTHAGWTAVQPTTVALNERRSGTIELPSRCTMTTSNAHNTHYVKCPACGADAWNANSWKPFCNKTCFELGEKPKPKLDVPWVAVDTEYQAGESPIRLSFAIKVF